MKLNSKPNSKHCACLLTSEEPELDDGVPSYLSAAPPQPDFADELPAEPEAQPAASELRAA